MADSPYFDGSYFDPDYFDADTTTGGRGGRVLPLPPPPVYLTDDELLALI